MAVTLFTTPGTTTWTATYTGNVYVEAWGGGGYGYYAGGNGGDYSAGNVAVVAGVDYSIRVGAGATFSGDGGRGGDTSFGANAILAQGGALNATGGGPASNPALGVGTIKYIGGVSPDISGSGYIPSGGGASATPSGNGGAPSGRTGGNAPSGGAGGPGGSPGADNVAGGGGGGGGSTPFSLSGGSKGGAPGGGGGGGGGIGGRGQLRITTFDAAPSGIIGSLSHSDSGDALNATGRAHIAATLVRTDAADQIAAVGFARVAGAAQITEPLDLGNVHGSVLVAGGLAISDADDTPVAHGSVFYPPVVGSLAVADVGDACAASGVAAPLPPVLFVDVTTNAGGAGTAINKPSGLQADDYMFVFMPHGNATISGGDGSWLKQTIAWPSLGYTTSVLFKKVSANDVSSTLTLNGHSTNGFVTVAYRGPANATVMSSNPAGTGTTLALTRNAKNTFSLGQVSFAADRDATGTPTPPSGWTLRSNFLAQYFQTPVADRIDGTQPSGSGTDTWTTFASGYDQVGFNIEVCADDPTALPAMSSNNLGGAYIVSASNESYGPAYLAFDQNNSTFWGSNPDVSWLKIQFPGKRKIGRYYVRNRTGFTNQTPTAWTFEGSNDDSSWTVLDTRSSVTFTDGGENSYAISSPGSYRYYRLNISDNSNNGTIAVVAGLRFDFLFSTAGAVGVVEANDSSDSTGMVLVKGAIAANDNDDSVAASASAPTSGSLAVIEVDDAITADAVMTYKGLYSTDAPDTLNATGQVRNTSWAGSAAILDEEDSITAYGAVIVIGFVTINDEQDPVSAHGLVRGYAPLPPRPESWNPEPGSSEAWIKQAPANEAWASEHYAEEDWQSHAANSKDWRR